MTGKPWLVAFASAVISLAGAPPSALGQSAQRGKLAEEATARARAAADKADWMNAGREAAMAAALAPARHCDLAVAAVSVQQGNWSEAVTWLVAAEAKPASKADDAEAAPWLALLRRGEPGLMGRLRACPKMAQGQPLDTLAKFVLGRAADPAALPQTCLWLRAPEVRSPYQVMQDSVAISPLADGYPVRAGKVELLLEGKSAVPFAVAGTQDAKVEADLPLDHPALQGSVSLRGLPAAVEVTVDGKPAARGQDGVLAVAPRRPHRMRVRAPGRVTEVLEITLDLAELRTVDIHLGRDAPLLPWLAVGGGVLLLGAGAYGWVGPGTGSVNDQLSGAKTDTATGRYSSIGYEDRKAVVDDANTARAASAALGSVGLAALVGGIIWRMAADLEPPEWRGDQLVLDFQRGKLAQARQTGALREIDVRRGGQP